MQNYNRVGHSSFVYGPSTDSLDDFFAVRLTSICSSFIIIIHTLFACLGCGLKPFESELRSSLKLASWPREWQHLLLVRVASTRTLIWTSIWIWISISIWACRKDLLASGRNRWLPGLALGLSLIELAASGEWTSTKYIYRHIHIYRIT